MILQSNCKHLSGKKSFWKDFIHPFDVNILLAVANDVISSGVKWEEFYMNPNHYLYLNIENKMLWNCVLLKFSGAGITWA